MEIGEIKSLLAHRYPFLLVDRVLELEAGKRIKALKNVTINEPFFQGHFPHFPVMPGVLIIEALAQASGLLSLKSAGVKPDDDTVIFFVGIDEARFKRPIVPGDTLILESELLLDRRGLVKYAVKASVGEQLACEAELMCTMRKIS
ncbi:MAG: 3-hydroxyacyl-ACP dehydratase FabZ [Betaproteobacteria bacterium]|nr:3-hydroxyacyl-ACP dehydratase FabZ [Betaproteobacteria bacterium]